MSILDEKLGFSDAPGKATLYEHLCMGLDWLLRDRSPRGLSRLGQGDWCDPLNMAGHRMKGESVMLSQNLVWALDMWMPCLRGGRRRKARRPLREGSAQPRKAINRLRLGRQVVRPRHQGLRRDLRLIEGQGRQDLAQSPVAGPSSPASPTRSAVRRSWPPSRSTSGRRPAPSSTGRPTRISTSRSER